MAVIYWKYNINKLLQLTLAEIYGLIYLPPYKRKFTHRGKFILG